MPEEAIEEVVRVVTRPPEPTLVRNNRWFHGLLCGGIEVEYRTAEGEIRGDRAWLVDFERVENNDFLVVNQFTVKREGEGGTTEDTESTEKEEERGLATKNAENTKEEEEEEGRGRGTTEGAEDTERKEEKKEEGGLGVG